VRELQQVDVTDRSRAARTARRAFRRSAGSCRRTEARDAKLRFDVGLERPSKTGDANVTPVGKRASELEDGVVVGVSAIASFFGPGGSISVQPFPNRRHSRGTIARQLILIHEA
jgi:hypothetical protein